MNKIMYSIMLTFTLLVSLGQAEEASTYVERAIDHWRGSSSRLKARMTVRRPDWNRSMSLESWTSGRDRSLVRFTAPPKDAGNASLIIDQSLWTFSPRVNRVIPIPGSMRTQSWMGSDFSYQDLAREDDILRDYDHTLVEERQLEGLTVRIIDAVPHQDAAVVWGRERLWIREDNIFLKHYFYDQDDVLIKVLEAEKVEELGGKLIPVSLTMTRKDKDEHQTRIEYLDGAFDIDFPSHLFTLSNLRNPR